MQVAEQWDCELAKEVDFRNAVLNMLRGGDHTLYRVEREQGERILLVVLDTDVVKSSRRLVHELTLQSELDAAWAASPIGLTYCEERPALMLQDPGGELLDRLIGQPLDAARLLQIAIGITEATRRVHERGLIHRDIKPANILIDPAGGRAWLTGFGIASRMGSEHQAPEPPAVIAGTLAYMAPEQTGRMNRATDSRSDLYALGVTLYELLTGSLPFTTSDPIELIHCHIAREPTPPSEHRSRVPEQLSSIVMKLLAKASEDRYQTALGLEADLRTCLRALEATGRIEPFPLGASDVSDRLFPPERLYGRQSQVSTLLDAFDRVAKTGAKHLVLVSGYSGIGKSSVVNELHKVIIQPRGILIAGKFDQRSRDTPYSTVAEAFQALIRQIMNGSAAEIGRWRDAVLVAVGTHGRLLIDLIPDLARMIGPQPSIPDLAPFDAQHRFQAVFKCFVNVFARREHPLLIFFDDLQWLDPATLALIEQLATDPDIGHLLFIGAYRDNEVDPNHGLRRAVAAIREAGTSVLEIALGPISLSDVTQIVADALRCPPTQARRLAGLIHRKTGGNPFFAIQFLTNLVEEGLISLHPRTRKWTWDLEGIDAKGLTDNLVELTLGRLKRLPQAAQTSLKHLACLGSSADAETLELVIGTSKTEINDGLRAAVQSRIIVLRGDHYRFLHDRVQEAAYALIPKSQRPALHLQIGEQLLTAVQDGEAAEKIFDIVNQLNLGASAAMHWDKRVRIARLNLEAGSRAKASTAYASASSYFTFGLSTLGDQAWNHEYDLASKLLRERAECELLGGSFAVAGELIELLLAKAQVKVDRTESYRLKVTLQLLHGQMTPALRTALECLEMFDMTFPEHPTTEDLRAEYNALQRKIGSRSIESLIHLPLMDDPEMLALGNLLFALGHASYFVDQNLYGICACRLVALSVDYGLSLSSMGFGSLALVLGPAFGRYEDGTRFARVAVTVAEKHRSLSLGRPSAYTDLQMASLWTRPIDDALTCLDAADKAARETGDVLFTCISAEHRITNQLARGEKLDLIWPKIINSVGVVRQKGYLHIVDVLLSTQQFVAALRGDASSAGIIYDEETLLRSDIPIVKCFYWVLQLQLRYLVGDSAGAIEAAEQAKSTLWWANCHIQAGTFRFYHALALLRALQFAPSPEMATLHEDLEDSLAALQVLATAAPHTYAHKLVLVTAEQTRLEGREIDAMRLYEDAVRTALNNGFIQEAALGAELAADFFASRGLGKLAHSYRSEARDYYRRWGALAKVAKLDELHPEIAPQIVQPRLPTVETSLQQLDLATVIRMSQAVAGELFLDRLIGTLMTIAIEHAGADRGLLILPHGNDLRVKAEARSAAATVSVRLVGENEQAPDLPTSILAHVRRTLAPVMLNDAREKTLLSTDVYLRLHHVRSVLCLPLVKQGELIGILHLENSLASYVFTPARIAVLTLLSSQMAISLEIACLYADLVIENRERQKAEEALREAQAELARATRLTTIGELVASITHEISQPLAAIANEGRAGQNFLGRESPDLDEARESLELINRYAHRAGEIIGSVRAMVTKSEPRFAWFDINDLVGEVLALARSQLNKHGVNLVTRLSSEGAAVYGDRVQLMQVMLNLLVNGAEAMGTTSGPRDLTIASRSLADGALNISVADTGTGVDAAAAARIFESFYTTKSTGMGMGLSICRSIISAHRGEIWLEQNAPRGAIFQFTLPSGSEAASSGGVTVS